MLFEDCQLTLRVRPNDLDSLGHVNNATVLEYLEAGRWAWMDQHGLRRGVPVLPVVSRIEVDYRRELLGPQARVRTWLESPPSAEELEDALTYRVTFRQQVLVDGDSQPAVEARLQVAFIDSAQRTLCTLQDFLAAARTSRP